ncbi:protein rolling stone-like [Lineus longissimus]|uniref:protein rolling stone-like n=1 Tax=Lineus longissimus TaxID=88925 RepID=UPI002B4D206B
MGRRGGACCGDNFGLNYKSPAHFFTSQWPFPPWLYLVYSIIAMIYIPAWLIAEGVVNFWLHYPGKPATQAKFFIYFTNWSYLVLSLVTIARGVGVCWYYRKSQSHGIQDDEVFHGGRMPTVIKIIWVFNNMALGSQVTMAIAFSIYAFGLGMGSLDREVPLSDPMKIHVHGIGALYILTNMLLSAVPVRIGHFFHVILFVSVYGIFNLAYELLGGTNKTGGAGVYSALDWNKQPLSTLLALVALCAVSIVWFVLFGLYRLRVFIHEKWFAKKSGYTVIEMD